MSQDDSRPLPLSKYQPVVTTWERKRRALPGEDGGAGKIFAGGSTVVFHLETAECLKRKLRNSQRCEVCSGTAGAGTQRVNRLNDKLILDQLMRSGVGTLMGPELDSFFGSKFMLRSKFRGLLTRAFKPFFLNTLFIHFHYFRT